jgi:hypothetical protein
MNQTKSAAVEIPGPIGIQSRHKKLKTKTEWGSEIQSDSTCRENWDKENKQAAHSWRRKILTESSMKWEMDNQNLITEGQTLAGARDKIWNGEEHLCTWAMRHSPAEVNQESARQLSWSALEPTGHHYSRGKEIMDVQQKQIGRYEARSVTESKHAPGAVREPVPAGTSKKMGAWTDV